MTLTSPTTAGWGAVGTPNPIAGTGAGAARGARPRAEDHRAHPSSAEWAPPVPSLPPHADRLFLLQSGRTNLSGTGECENVSAQREKNGPARTTHYACPALARRFTQMSPSTHRAVTCTLHSSGLAGLHNDPLRLTTPKGVIRLQRGRLSRPHTRRDSEVGVGYRARQDSWIRTSGGRPSHRQRLVLVGTLCERAPVGHGS